MGEAEERILQMVADGVISAEEANKLLSALGPGQKAEAIAGDPVLAKDFAVEGPAGPPPGLNRFRRLWLIPLFIAGGSLLLSSFGLLLMYQSTQSISAIGFLCIWSVFLLALLFTVALLLGQRAAWLYLQVEEKSGMKIAFGMPMPLGLVGWGARLARPFVPEDQAMHLETAAFMVSAMKEDPERQPITIDVEDDEDEVHIYIG